MNFTTLQKEFFEQLIEPFTCEALFDQLIDMVYFVKNSLGQYILVNQALVIRCGFQSKNDLIGKRPDEVYPKPLGCEYRKQDEELLREGKPILNQLELQIAPTLSLGWCLTTKVPLHGPGGRVVGLAGVSRDLQVQNKKSEEFQKIAESVSYIKKNYHESLIVEDLADMAGMSLYQYEQRMQKIFNITAGQFIQKTRMEAALWKLRETDEPIIDISLNCGYADQSAFSRQFKKTIGISPAQYRYVVNKR